MGKITVRLGASEPRARSLQLALATPPSLPRMMLLSSFAGTLIMAYSLLWLLERALRNDDTLELAKQFAEEALEWMREDDVAQSVSVVAEWIGTTPYLQLTIEIVRNPGARRWVSVWDATAGRFLRAA